MSHFSRSQAKWPLLAIFSLMASSGMAQTRLIPHVTAPDGGFTSQITIANLTASHQEVRLTGYNSSGQWVETAMHPLEPFQSLTNNAFDTFDSSVSHFEIDADEAGSVGVTIIYRRNRATSGTAHVNATCIQAHAWQILSGNPDLTWDGLAAVNMGDSPADFLVSQVGTGGETTTGPVTIAERVPSKGKILYLFSQDFTPQANVIYRVSANEPFALTALRGNLDSDFLWENPANPIHSPASPVPRVMAHVTSATGGFKTKIIVSNPSDSEQFYAMHGYDEAGHIVKTAQGGMPPGQTETSDIVQWFGGQVSHFEITGASDLLVSLQYQKDRENAGFAQVQASGRTNRNWRIYPGTPSITWDGLAVVNRGDEPSGVLANQIDQNGSLVKGPITIAGQLPPNGKALYLFATDFEFEAGSAFEINASQPLALIALRGNLASDFLWENGATALPDPGPAPVPPSRIDYAFSFDTGKKVGIMSGGFDENFALLADTWLWNGRRWRQVQTTGSLLPRSHHGGTFDAQNQRVIVFGGFESQFNRRNDFRWFDGNGWQPLSGHPAIPQQDGELVFDSNRNVIVLTVPSGNRLQTWENNNAQWMLKDTVDQPGKRLDQGLIYDTHRNTTVLFGGLDGSNQPTNQTWEYDGVNWVRVQTPTSPPALYGMAMFYDSVRQRTIIFGGMNASRQVTDETWSYDGISWQKLSPPSSPAPRWVAFAAYDPQRGVATIFGGEGGSGSNLVMYDDTWEFDGTQWQKR